MRPPLQAARTARVLYSAEWADGVTLGVVEYEGGLLSYARWDRRLRSWRPTLTPEQLGRIRPLWLAVEPDGALA